MGVLRFIEVLSDVCHGRIRLAAEVYKSYMACAVRIIKDEDGSITAYDGDRVMGIFIGNVKNTTATGTGEY